MARLEALTRESADPAVIREVEGAALEALRRQLVEIVGPVKVEGFSTSPRNHVAALADSRSFGQLDGLEFAADKPGGALVVTTRALLRLWMAQRPSSKAAGAAMATDQVYGEALHPHESFEGVADIALPRPQGVAFAAAKLGRWGAPGETSAPAALIVTVMKGERVFVVDTVPTTALLELSACAGLAGDQQAWRSCERRGLPKEPYFADLKREAREISERLAGAR
jgi:hypothetical protein